MTLGKRKHCYQLLVCRRFFLQDRDPMIPIPLACDYPTKLYRYRSHVYNALPPHPSPPGLSECSGHFLNIHKRVLKNLRLMGSFRSMLFRTERMKVRTFLWQHSVTLSTYWPHRSSAFMPLVTLWRLLWTLAWTQGHGDFVNSVWQQLSLEDQMGAP